MTPPPRRFRLVYRSFARIEFDPRKSDEVLAGRGFDLGYISKVFPGYVLEREDSRGYTERRFQVIGEVLGDIYVIIYTLRRDACRIITARMAEPEEWELWYDFTR